VMAYLTYIIEEYDSLPDVSIFLHHHRIAWHNNDLLGNSIVETLQRLNINRVYRLGGYMNLRCNWDPGCPTWIRTKDPSTNLDTRLSGYESPFERPADDPERNARRQQGEDKAIIEAWPHLFPNMPLPEVLAQPCCSQFAATRESIRAVSFAHWNRIRDWVLDTRLPDSLSGRVFEYIWQVALANVSEACAPMHACYCDGYGVCFEDDAALSRWYEAQQRHTAYSNELAGLLPPEPVFDKHFELAVRNGEVIPPDSPVARRRWVEQQRTDLKLFLDEQKTLAIERGQDPRFRAHIDGRAWQEGDGF